MDKNLLLQFAERLMRCPAVAYHESLVAAEVKAICDEQGIEWRQDKFGNILASYKAGRNNRALVLAAHMDHPGFILTQQKAPKKFEAEFHGGVGDSYFGRGIPLLLMPGRTKARLGKRVAAGKKVFAVESAEAPVEKPVFAVWDLPEFKFSNDRITGRVCDDLIGVAAALATLVRLKQARAKVHVIAAITRAEEIGFRGALALAHGKAFPRGAVVVSLETSRELPPVKQGAGVIIRTGDRASTFGPEATRFLHEVAGAIQKKNKTFKFQRALMSGGTCEATAFQEYGCLTGAVCVALGNYHNCATGNKIGAEYVSRADAESMVELLSAAARELKNFDRWAGRLKTRLEKLRKEGEKRLLAQPLS